MWRAIGRTVGQIGEPVFLAVLIRSIGWSVLAFLALGASLVWLTVAQVGENPQGLGAALLVFAASAYLIWLLFVPLVVTIAGLFTERIARAVEGAWYPSLPPAAAAPLSAQLWDGVALGVRLAAAQLLVLAVLWAMRLTFWGWLPGLTTLLWLAVSGWAFGRGAFVSVAMRRMARAEALAAYHARRSAVVGIGVLAALAALVPVLNLAAPVLGIAAMVHLLHDPDLDRMGTAVR